jgi:hypothetical protein
MLLVVLGLLTSSVQAQVVISNLPNTVTGGSFVTATEWKAMLFTTGSLPTQLSSIALGLNPITSAPVTQHVSISIYSVSYATPATLLATTGLTAVAMSATGGVYTFDSLPDLTFSASTSYALAISSDATGIKWGRNANVSPTTSDGFAYSNFLGTNDIGASWGTVTSSDNAFSITVCAVPEPSSYALLAGLTMLGMVATRRRRPVAA